MNVTLSRPDETRQLLEEAGKHLREAEAQLRAEPPDYSALFTHSVQTIRHALRAFLMWHDIPHDADAPLRELVGLSVPLATSLVTPTDLALNLADVDGSLKGSDELSVTQRQEIRTGYYVARNTYLAVLGELPASLQRR